MTVATTAPRAEYLENGVTTVHAIPFQFFDAAEIVVYRIQAGIETLLAQPTHYSVSGGGGDVGLITKINGGVDGATIRIDRDTKRSQEANYEPGDAFPAEQHEEGLDRLEMQVQELKRDQLDRGDILEIVAAILVAGDGISFELDADGGTITINNTMADVDTLTAMIGDILLAGSGIELTVAAGTITIASSSAAALQDCLLLETALAGADTSAEAVRDIIAAALQGLGCAIVVDDAGNTITVDLTQAVTAEVIRDAIAAALVAGSGVAITINDLLDTITIAVDDERIRDAIGTCLVAGAGITITVDDAGNTITIAATGLDATYKGIVPTVRNAAFNFDNAMNGRATDYTGSAANATIRLEATYALDAGWSHEIRNRGSGNLTIHRETGGVSLVRPPAVVNGDVAIAPGAVAFLRRWAADDFTIMVS